MMHLEQQILRTDVAGMPLEWISYRDAARLYFLDHVAYTVGQPLFTIHGGINAISRKQSKLQLHSIIATHGNSHPIQKMRDDYVPPLCNDTLFRRDDNICLYCGNEFPRASLSRDHVTPISQGGRDHWRNVVTACVRCNNHKAGRTPEQAQMELMAIPFKPTHAEYVFLQGRNVLADQMEFLRSHFPRTSPLYNRLCV
ncbi:HNH endonuclease [Solemya velum gill symbiont]|uniref:HNH endonuclease n=1 Tax=Solemya velum gill symbiont TaxID=2340 RepID=UPI000997B603|nr:HNH endonuclease [Solemya velum gill symbiont]OOZ76895.1 HNH endonuclease [Solemya velum gill symbiont]